MLANVMKGELDIGMEMQIQTLSKEFVVWLNWGCELKMWFAMWMSRSGIG